ncbi:type II toxin-antitoxin system PemK/MazF family toxin [Pseudohongiella spirulinae]|uniref:Potassium ABC transporter ATPase n=1 Tax=Pseudohongiella spirulinae TaxID=1249552 RepID=A0A0S2KDF4_9GAMM|nr:type II toxin-antitoxin system PemK/MazF family toxin [Pseudohongiella spirulinae]ALO46346.1 Potassium ABC transporter ATPase [Pseudohongiella spirulinae]
MAYIPARGDIIWTDFDPSAGHEQARRRPAIVLSPEVFNWQIKLALVAPITSRIRGHGFEVHLQGTTTQGAVLCQQVKTIDYDYRGVKFIEAAPTGVLNEVLAKVRTLVT